MIVFSREGAFRNCCSQKISKNPPMTLSEDWKSSVTYANEAAVSFAFWPAAWTISCECSCMVTQVQCAIGMHWLLGLIDFPQIQCIHAEFHLIADTHSCALGDTNSDVPYVHAMPSSVKNAGSKDIQTFTHWCCHWVMISCLTSWLKVKGDWRWRSVLLFPQWWFGYPNQGGVSSAESTSILGWLPMVTTCSRPTMSAVVKSNSKTASSPSHALSWFFLFQLSNQLKINSMEIHWHYFIGINLLVNNDGFGFCP